MLAFERAEAAIRKTISMDNSKVHNVAPRVENYALEKPVKLWLKTSSCSDRPYDVWLKEFREVKEKHPDGMLIASIMEEYNKTAKVATEVEAGVDGFELNLSCPWPSRASNGCSHGSVLRNHRRGRGLGQGGFFNSGLGEDDA